MADLKISDTSNNYKININQSILVNNTLIVEIMLNETPPQVVDSDTQQIVDKRRLGICIEEFELKEEELD